MVRFGQGLNELNNLSESEEVDNQVVIHKLIMDLMKPILIMGKTTITNSFFMNLEFMILLHFMHLLSSIIQ